MVKVNTTMWSNQKKGGGAEFTTTTNGIRDAALLYARQC